jgi:U3 small nucleolar RNA-associated protein 15
MIFCSSLNRKKSASRGIQHRYLQFTNFEPQSGDIVVKQNKTTKELRHDHFLRKFEYTKALDQVLKPYVQRKFPEYTYSVLMELNRRNGLKTALGGRDEKSLILLLNYLCKYVNDPRFSYFLMYIVDQTLDLYAPTLGNCPATDKLFVDLRKRIHRETQNIAALMELQGALDLILTASHTKDPPELRCEEKAFKRHLQKANDGYTDAEGINLMKDRLSAPSDTVLSWEKTLIHSVL